MAAVDWDNDNRDGVLFRFWIRAASYPEGWPFETAGAIAACTTPAEYRRALTELAKKKGVNLPPASNADAVLRVAGNTVTKLREALADVVDGTPAHHLAEEAGVSIERAREIRKLAGLDPNG